MNILLSLSIIVVTFIIMEFVAWFTHKYIMHGFLWVLHKDHHQKEPGFFEKNDAFFVIFAVPSITLFAFGAEYSSYLLVSIGLGILMYGIAYFFVHEVFIHKRLKWFKNQIQDILLYSEKPITLIINIWTKKMVNRLECYL